MTKIFQLELFIQDITLWQIPPSRHQDEIAFDVSVFDCKNVPIKRRGSGTMSRGQNFLFTLNAIPADENAVSFNVSRITNEKKLVGTGTIPIHKLFGDIFLETFKRPEIVQQPEIVQPVDATDDTKVKNVSKTAQPQKQLKQNATKNDSKSLQQSPNKKGRTSDGKQQQQQKTGEATKNDTTQDVASMEDTQKPIAPPWSPISWLTKDIYPIIDTDSNQCGIVCILIRLTSFGDSTAYPIHIHQNHKEIIIQNTQNRALYRRLPLDELRNNRHSEDLRFISAFPSNAGKNELIYNRGPQMKDFNFQCNDKDILGDIHQKQKSLMEQERIL